MDRVLCARVDESVANRIGTLARRLRTSKKNVIERAVELDPFNAMTVSFYAVVLEHARGDAGDGIGRERLDLLARNAEPVPILLHPKPRLPVELVHAPSKRRGRKQLLLPLRDRPLVGLGAHPPRAPGPPRRRRARR